MALGGATGGAGAVFQLTETAGNWALTSLHPFSGASRPWGDLIMDSSGNIYGTTVQDGTHGFGSVFKLTFSGGSCVYSTLHDFNATDRSHPHGSIVLDASGNLSGVASDGWTNGQGVVWEKTP